MFQRRDVLRYGFTGLTATIAERLGLAAAHGQTAPGFGFGDEKPFDFAMVVEAARALARQPYKAPPNDLPGALTSLSYDQYVGIRLRPEATIWAGENLGFALEPLPRGFAFTAAMQINIVAQGVARRLVYNQASYDFGKLTPPANAGETGFSGFRVLAAQGAGLAELASFQGASFFRAVARGQNPGTMARALSIKTGDASGEEFPAIRAVWIERPSVAGGILVIHALIDSQSSAGACRFTVRPGEATIVDTECTLIARSFVENYGIATMSATNLFGNIGHRRADDLRPNVLEVGGLQVLTGAGEWLWRPVANRETLQISTFVDQNPRGFGFLQRDRDFSHYQDDDQHWERRPSLWIEPIGDWGAGVVQLLEIPSESEINDNIIAYWRPKNPLTPGTEAAFNYRQFWCWNPPERPPAAVVTLSRFGRGAGKKQRFIVEFTGDALATPPAGSVVTPRLTIAPGQITSMRPFVSHDGKVFRLLCEFDPGSEASVELRLVLEAGGKAISETWLYRWTA